MTPTLKVPDAQVLLPPAVARLIDLALDEDLGRGDVTSEAIFGSHETAQAVILAKSELVLSGLDVAMAVFQAVDRRILTTALFADGSSIHPQTQVLRVEGPLRSILAAERTALNFLQRLSGIATLSRRYVQAVAGTSARIVDTRKTLPGFRFLDKRAVRHGGAHNHRADLGSGVLIKDNHVAAAGDVAEAIRRAREYAPHSVRIEAEVTSIEQVSKALAARADIILLDNMSPEMVREAMATLPNVGDPRRPLIEVSGGVSLATVRAYAEAGADLISVGALTHSVTAADLSLEVEV
ncbi:MAG TPA: carboxylating nicotinate-nucleotide diphosphorylase [Pseudomonadota bacterium]|nr:carboxylating nicotinate-nucleotide diphosphorylase [Pseudomonadota bacterium]HNK45613.1 carboxylating nicotinate-nucleotide diphosphorylase [Pseudomonadota bacterium]HNN51169.1 carboxylating nicotinate-nucleotide diphosphorylase [Pseudomonadota bacterium]